MAYEAQTEEGKAALKNGADEKVVEEMEKSGELAPDDKKDEKVAEDVDKEDVPEDKKSDDKDQTDDQGGEGDKSKADDDSNKDEDEGPNREVKYMPAWKHKEELKKQRETLEAEFEQKLQEAGKKAATREDGASDEEVKKFAETFNLEENVAATMIDRMADIVTKRTGLDEIRKSVDEGKALQKTVAEEKGFNDEYSGKDAQDSLKAVAGDKPITDAVRNKVKELAYTTTYARYRISDIVRLNADTLFPASAKESRSAEQGRGGAGRGSPTKTINEMSEEDINNLSDSEFEKLSDSLGGSRFSKITQPKKK